MIYCAAADRLRGTGQEPRDVSSAADPRSHVQVRLHHKMHSYSYIDVYCNTISGLGRCWYGNGKGICRPV